ncbi:MAG: hypothetical protein ACRDYE_05395 [Acidimicrobiales bacterium]
MSGAEHLRLYENGYKHISVIGPLFLLQAVGSFILGAGGAILRRAWSALLCAGCMIFTLVAFLVSVNYGLFGFQDAFAGTDAVGTFAVEVIAAALLLLAAALAVHDLGRANSRAQQSSAGDLEPGIVCAVAGHQTYDAGRAHPGNTRGCEALDYAPKRS